ncbi:MAG TPA: quaternary ammonium compound efflux SMR transporter SugE [Gammaproteobacteria bacterium]|jgi:quaternary ammonium compound-resistance protein SugE|nr:quaternary ammonium compound efflux SMR transporter SugE [Gammaproteobacteria bacterium]
MSPAQAWILLVVAGLFEVAWAIGLKYTEGFTKTLPTSLTLAAMGVSMGLLGLVTRQLPIGTAYAVWTGIGVFGTAVLGMYLFGESTTAIRLGCLALILTGIVGLKLTS